MMVAFWEKLNTEKEKQFLRGFMPKGWQPPKPLAPLVKVEPFEEIERLMQALPRGDAVLVGRKG